MASSGLGWRMRVGMAVLLNYRQGGVGAVRDHHGNGGHGDDRDDGAG